jgi:hypothetical protein
MSNKAVYDLGIDCHITINPRIMEEEDDAPPMTFPEEEGPPMCQPSAEDVEPPMGQPSASTAEDQDEDLVGEDLENEDTEKDIQTTTRENKSDDAKKSSEAAELKKKLEEIAESKQMKFIDSTTLDDVLVDENNPIKVGRQSNDVTHLQSIKGCSSKRLSTQCLRRFCSVHHISGYKNKPKTFLCNLIVERNKTKGLDASMYPENFGKKTDKKSDKKKTSDGSNKIAKLSKNAKPPAVTMDGSYWRAIMTFFLQTMTPHVIKLGNNPHVDKVDGRRFLHEDIWILLAGEYNRSDHPDLKMFLRDDVYYQQAQVPADIPSKFDTLTPIELSQLLSHIRCFYRKAVRLQRTSGSHCKITKHIGPRPWLLLYDKSLLESSIEMKAYVGGDLPEGIGGSYLKRSADVKQLNTSDSDDEKKPSKKKVKASKQESEKLRVARAMEQFGEAARERSSLLKYQAKETSEIRAAELDKRLTTSFGDYKNKVKEGRADLRALKKDLYYDSESSEVQDVKHTISFYKDKAAAIFTQLEEKKKVVKVNPEIVVIDTAQDSTSESSLSPPLAPLVTPRPAPRPPRVSESSRVINSDEEEAFPTASGVGV